MPRMLAGGVFAVSVVLEADAGQGNPAEDQVRAQTAFNLIELLTRYDVPATWAVSLPDPAVMERLRDLQAHELAIIADPDWIGVSPHRQVLAGQLTSRLDRLQSEGWAPTTVFLRTPWPDRDLDLLIKQGISAVCPLSLSRTQREGLDSAVPYQGLRYSLWSLAASSVFPKSAGWLATKVNHYGIRRALGRASAQESLYHLVVDGQAFAATRGAYRTLENIIWQAYALRRAGKISVETLRTIADRLTRPPRIQRAQSILRPAA